MNSKQKLINKNPNNDYKSMIDSWVSNTIQDIEKLWEIPISKAESGIGFNVSISYLCLIMGCSEGVALKYRHLAIPLIEKMMEENILVTLEEGEYVAAIEYRRKLLKWYRKLSLESKKELPILGNKISFKKLSSNLNPISKKALEFKLVKQTLDDIYDDLTKIGILNPNYKTFADRKRERYLNKKINVEFKIKRFTRLSQFKLNHINDFIKPSEKEPFIQVEQLFACQSLTVASTSSRRNYLNACNIFVKFLTRTYGNEPFVITNKFDEHIFCKYRKYLEQEIINKSISSHSANSNFCLVRITLNRLIMIDGMSLKFFDSIGFQTSRETELKKPFSKKERVQILEAIEKAISDSRTYLLPEVTQPFKKALS